MYGPIFSVLFMGMVPLWGSGTPQDVLPSAMLIAPPASQVAGEMPVLTIPGRLSASGIIIMDLKSGQTLYQRSATIKRPMASLTKLMTALIILENHPLDTWVSIPMDVASVPGSSANLPAGDQVMVKDLLSALLISSANDAAYTLAVFDAGSTDAFIEKMNKRALELGLKRTSYATPTGLDDPRQRSTPQDTAWLSMFVLRHHEIARRMAITEAQFQTKNGVTISLTHTHTLLHEEGSHVVAGKTGTTDGAGQCLLSIVEYQGRQYLVVILSSVNRYADMRRILSVLAPRNPS